VINSGSALTDRGDAIPPCCWPGLITAGRDTDPNDVAVDHGYCSVVLTGFDWICQFTNFDLAYIAHRDPKR
jgi:hypothetical protein